MTSKNPTITPPDGILPVMPDAVRGNLEIHRRICVWLDDQMRKKQSLTVPADLVAGYQPEAADDCLKWLLQTVKDEYAKSATIRFINLFEAIHELITGQARCARTEPFTKVEGGLLRFFIDRPIPRDKTTIILDATGTKEQYEVIFGYNSVVDHRIPDVAHDSEIIQVINSSFSRKYLKYDLTEQHLASGKSSRPGRMVERIIKSTISRHPGSRFGLITYEAFVKLISSLFPPGVKTLHFGNQRGSNKLEDCQVLFVIGVPLVPAATVRHEAERIFGREVAPEEPTEVWTTVCGDNGAAWVKTRGYTGKEMQVAYEAKVGAELIQAVGRSRYVNGGKFVYVLANHPLKMPGVTLVDGRELLGDLHVRRDSLFTKVEQRVRAAVDAGQPVEVGKIAADIGCSRQAVSRHWATIRARLTMGVPSLANGSETRVAHEAP